MADVDPIEGSIGSTNGQRFRFSGTAGDDTRPARQQMQKSSALQTPCKNSREFNIEVLVIYHR